MAAGRLTGKGSTPRRLVNKEALIQTAATAENRTESSSVCVCVCVSTSSGHF